ncbi:hypothetical protein Tco_0377270 [Tanacetum coccineum]
MSYLVPLIAVVFVVVAGCYLASVPQEEDHKYVIAILGLIVPLIIMAIGVEAFWKRSSSLAVTSSGLSSDVSDAGLPSEKVMASGKNGDDGDLLLFRDGPGACDISAGALRLFISQECSRPVAGVKVNSGSGNWVAREVGESILLGMEYLVAASYSGALLGVLHVLNDYAYYVSRIYRGVLGLGIHMFLVCLAISSGILMLRSKLAYLHHLPIMSLLFALPDKVTFINYWCVQAACAFCALPHTDSEVEALVQRLINEDKGRQDVLLNLAFHSEKDRKLHLSMYGKAAHLEKQMETKSAWFQEKYFGRTHGGIGCSSSQTDFPLTEKELHQLHMYEEALKEMLEEEAMNKKAQEEKIRQEQAENDAFFLEFGVVKYDSDCESSD